MPRPRHLVAVGLLLSSCGNARLEQAERRLEAVSATYQHSEQDVHDLRVVATQLLQNVDAARRDYESAVGAYRSAAGTAEVTSDTLKAAALAYEEASARFRTVTTFLIVASASDLFLRGVCGPRTSTAQYRRQLRANGVDLEGKDIDHIIARARGGPDRPWNYMPLESSINRSLGKDGLLWKLSEFPLHTLDALAKNAAFHLIC